MSEYTFFPWARSGLSNLVTGGMVTGCRPQIVIALTLDETKPDEVKRPIVLLGPADVRGLHPGAILRTVPGNGAPNFSPDYFPCVEFAEPEVPWQYTPSLPTNERLTPWLVLIVVPVSQVKLEHRAEGCSILTFLSKPQLLSLDKIDTVPDVNAVALPPLKSAWAMAHVQVLGKVAKGQTLEAIENDAPERTVSRLIYPFLLAADTQYMACVVPTYMVGVTGGLGYDPYEKPLPKLPVPAYAWDSGYFPSALPVYHHWRFKTGSSGTFVDLVKKLGRVPMTQASGVGCAALDLSELVPGVQNFAGIPTVSDPPRHGPIGGVLRAPGMRSLAYQWSSDCRQRFEQAITAWMGTTPADSPLEITTATGSTPPKEAETKASSSSTTKSASANANNPGKESGISVQSTASKPLVKRSTEVRLRGVRVIDQDYDEDDPVITPPLYGGWQAGVRSTKPDDWTEWMVPLNLDPGLRATAGLGVRAVQKHQEALMASAWEQLEQLQVNGQPWREAHQQRQNRALSRRVQRRHHERRLTRLKAPSLLQLTGQVHHRLPAQAGGDNFRQALAAIGLIPALNGPRFRRNSRPGAALARQVLLSRVDGSTSIPERTKHILAALQTRPVVVSPSDSEQMAGGTRDLLSAFPRELTKNLTNNPDWGALSSPYVAMSNSLSGWTEPETSSSPSSSEEPYCTHLLECLNPSNTLKKSQPAPMPYPTFAVPAYGLLVEEAPYLLLPGVEHVDPDTLTVVEVNGRFVEAYLAGMNHEMARELLWRGFPTDQRGSYFRRFWDTHTPEGTIASDVEPMHSWNEPLGKNEVGGGSSNRLVLLIRGELLQRFPNAIVYARKARWDAGQGKRVFDESVEPRLPLFSGVLPPDISFFGFPLEYREAFGSEDRSKDQGWWFVLQEQPTELRFGKGTDWRAQVGAATGTAATAAVAAIDPPDIVAIHADDLLPP